MSTRGRDDADRPADRPAPPPSMCIELDPSVRRVDGGRVLIGGSPITLLRLSATGAEAVDELSAGEPIGDRPAVARLARSLLDRGLAHPVPDPAAGPFTTGDVTAVIPVHDHPAALDRTLTGLFRSRDRAGSGRDPRPDRRVVVVDDGSADAAGIAAVARRHGAGLVRHDDARGPAAARNAGLALVATPLVAFVDCDVEVDPDWLDHLLPHLADPAVAAVAPRVRSRNDHAGSTDAVAAAMAAYDEDRSPLDLGPRPARVAPRTRVAYVPATALVARTEVVHTVGGFDEDLRFGEDVDLVWRLHEAGHTVRYEPTAVVTHPVRTDPGSWLRQRFSYGTSAAPLAERHPDALAPVAVSAWSAGAWALVATGHPVLGLGVAAAATAQLPAKLGALDHPWPEAVRLAGLGTWGAWRPLASAVTRSWWPAALGAAVVSKRARRAVVLAAVVPPLVDWWRSDRRLDAPRSVVLRLADDAAYGAGVWAGCLRAGRWDALRPDLTSWPGRRRS